MPRAKAETKVEETQVTPQEEPQVAPETTGEVAETKVEENVKVYNFTSKNPYLSCAGLGVQFIEGKASTSNLVVARALAKIDGVELVED